MKTKLITLICAACLTVPALADDDKKKGETGVSAAPEQIMEMWAKANVKGEQHEAFKELVGEWNSQEKHFMGADSFDGKGWSKFYTMLDGRYLAQEYKSESPMGNFEGFGITAYDAVAKQYVMAWMDSMSTGIVISKGDEKGDSTIYTGSQKMPDGSVMQNRYVIKQINSDRLVMTLLGKLPGQEKFEKSMEITYTRIK